MYRLDLRRLGFVFFVVDVMFVFMRFRCSPFSLLWKLGSCKWVIGNLSKSRERTQSGSTQVQKRQHHTPKETRRRGGTKSNQAFFIFMPHLFSLLCAVRARRHQPLSTLSTPPTCLTVRPQAAHCHQVVHIRPSHVEIRTLKK